MITEAKVQAAMRAVEEETIQRCADIIRQYAKSKNDTRRKPSSRIAAAKQIAANELVSKDRGPAPQGLFRNSPPCGAIGGHQC